MQGLRSGSSQFGVKELNTSSGVKSDIFSVNSVGFCGAHYA
jgi:hypothetical protein